MCVCVGGGGVTVCRPLTVSAVCLHTDCSSPRTKAQLYQDPHPDSNQALWLALWTLNTLCRTVSIRNTRTPSSNPTREKGERWKGVGVGQ